MPDVKSELNMRSSGVRFQGLRGSGILAEAGLRIFAGRVEDFRV